MKKQLAGSILLILALTLCMSSCGKYEDGPAFSLASKRSRAANEWVVDRVLINGNEGTTLFNALYPNFSLNLNINNDYITTWTTNLIETGTWMFDASHDNIITTPSNSSISTTWKILRLKSNELWAETTSGGDVYEYHLIPR
jgi:hypothetical protein